MTHQEEEQPNISDRRVHEFQEAYRKEFKEEISPGEARIMLGRLVELYYVIGRPLPGEEGGPRAH